MKKLNDKLRMNIQMFAEEAANATDEVTETLSVDADNANGENDNLTFKEQEVENTQPTTDSKKDTTKAFSDRLKKERAKIEQEYAKKQQDSMDKIAISRGFKNWKELEAYSNKDRLEAMGIQNPEDFNSYVEEIVAKSPIIEEAKKILDSQRQKEEEQLITDAINEINKLDPEIKSLDDLTKLENYDEFYGLIQKGYSIPDAYKIVAFDKITTRRINNARQDVITNIDSKNHMKPLSGTKSKEIHVPQDVLDSYHKNIPSMTDQEIREHYSKFIGGK